MAEGDGRSLTRHEFDAVIRRAAELASSDPDGTEKALSEGELYRIAGEVGLSEGHVRRALAEMRSGELGSDGVLDRIFGPSFVRASRVVPGEPQGLGVQIDEFLVASQLLQPVRRGATMLQYRPAVDWASQVARAASSTTRKYYIASAKLVEVRFDVIDDERTLVEFLVDPGTRGDGIGGAVFGGGAAGGTAGALTGMALASAAPLALAVGAGVLIGGAIWAGVGYSVGHRHKRKLAEVRAEIEGVLDSLERGLSLEPPPSSWRRWVKRHFHGVARDLMGEE